MNKTVIAVLAVLVITACNKNPVEGQPIVCTTIHDTIFVKDSVREIELENTIVVYKDSVDRTKHINDSINKELFIAKYKLERIRYYNSIAAKGNNISFLRGWINRVLDK